MTPRGVRDGKKVGQPGDEIQLSDVKRDAELTAQRRSNPATIPTIPLFPEGPAIKVTRIPDTIWPRFNDVPH